MNILQFPEDLEGLRTHAKAVKEIDGKLQILIDQMLETMYAHRGVGLASTQVGVAQRFFVMDTSEHGDQPLVLINPEIIQVHGELEWEEGCLSIPGIYEKTTRHRDILVRALDRDGKPFEMEATDLKGVCIQHELDHLDGKLFIDQLSRLKQNQVRKKIQKLRKEKELDAAEAAEHSAEDRA
jgi:peptide deformylase